MMQRTQRIEFRPWIPLLIGGVPALGYAVAYVYELGYCGVYHIPSDLIRLDLTTILLPIAASLIGLALFAWFFFATLTIPLYINPTLQKILLSILLFICLFGLSLRYFTTEEAEQTGIAFLVFLVLLFAGPPLLRKLQTKRGRRRQDIPLARLLANRYFQYTLISICVVGLIFASGYLGGRAEAFQKEVFYVPSSNPDLVVLKIYGDNIICGELVRQSDEVGLGATISVLRMENIPNLTLTPIKTKISFTLYPK
jgi:hypothetical protein